MSGLGPVWASTVWASTVWAGTGGSLTVRVWRAIFMLYGWLPGWP